MHGVGSSEAKTHLPQLLERVEQGETIIITRHGKPVARLVPAVADAPRLDVAAVIAAIADFQGREAPTLGEGISIGDLIAEGRR